MNNHEAYLNDILKDRLSRGALRTLKTTDNLIDFCSNDYLGFARSRDIRDKIAEAIRGEEGNHIGSTGSRLLTGNSRYAEELEAFIARYHHAEAALIFNSGYDANLGLLSTVAGRDDTILYDELSHASIRDGIRLSRAKAYAFRHNDLQSLREKLKVASGRTYVVVESVYSMDGDFAPLKELAELCGLEGVHLIVDEAHATGLYGEKGEGRVVELGIEDRCIARVHTFGKALGCHGAVVLGSTVLRKYLINFCRPFIYTTALPKHNLIAIRSAYDILSKSKDKINHTSNLVNLFKHKIEYIDGLNVIDSESPIQGVLIPGNEAVKQAAARIQRAGFDVRPILSPTVPKGSERIRIVLHAFNTEKEVDGLINVLKSI